MSIFDGILGTIATTLKDVAEHAVPGAHNVIATVEALGTAFDSLKKVNGSSPAAAQADRDAAMARVQKHADETAKRLEGI